jgi:hypothetical protein
MTDDSTNWIYIAQARIRENDNRITIPETVINEAEIVTTEDDAVWSYDQSGFVVISNRNLLGKNIDQGCKYIDSHRIDQNRITYIPKRLFSDSESHREPIQDEKTTFDPKFEYGQKVFFAAHEDMDSGKTRSCYVFTEEQLMGELGTPF